MAKKMMRLTVLSKYGSKAERPNLGCQCCRRRGNHVVLNSNGTCRYYGNQEKPKRSAITIVSALARIKVRKSIDTFGENDTVGRKDHAAHYMTSQIDDHVKPRTKKIRTTSSDKTDDIVFPCGAVDLTHSYEEICQTVIVSVRFAKLSFLCNDITGKRWSRASAPNIDIFFGVLHSILAVSAYSIAIRVSDFDFTLVTEFLGCDESGIGPVFMVEQLTVGTLLENGAITHDKDAVGVLDRRKAMSDGDRRAS